ncbi:SRPBCC family protein [uncultured Jatrophihabitans sp.]|uniref:SRPBCC family protein n=1 Tax=uncultured Jatrophihabitans sp. TaxID=1610747 RepID=UPI0035CB098F
MPSAERTFTVTTAPTVVLNYLKDFSHAEEWDPGTETCTQNGAGPVQVGTSWHNTSKLAGRTTELTYTLTELTNDKLVFVGENDSAKTIDTITVRPAGAGSEVTYHANLELRGAAKLATPLAKLGFEKLGNDTEKQLTEVLNGLSG